MNPDISQPREAEIAVHGGSVASGTVSTLTHTDIHARNSFDHLDAVMPATIPLKTDGQLVHTFPPASITALSLQLR